MTGGCCVKSLLQRFWKTCLPVFEQFDIVPLDSAQRIIDAVNACSGHNSEHMKPLHWMSLKRNAPENATATMPWNVKASSAISKAPEDWRTPRRFATNGMRQNSAGLGVR